MGPAFRNANQASNLQAQTQMPFRAKTKEGVGPPQGSGGHALSKCMQFL